MATQIRRYDNMDSRIAKEWAEAKGFEGDQGGWIYSKKTGRPVAQGWSQLYRKFELQILDWVTREHTGFATFDEMVKAKGSYRPTMHLDYHWHFVFLALAYNRSQRTRKDPRRVYVGSWPKNLPIWVQAELQEPSC